MVFILLPDLINITFSKETRLFQVWKRGQGGMWLVKFCLITNVTRQLVELTPHSRVTCGIHLTNWLQIRQNEESIEIGPFFNLYYKIAAAHPPNILQRCCMGWPELGQNSISTINKLKIKVWILRSDWLLLFDGTINSLLQSFWEMKQLSYLHKTKTN